MGKPGISNSIVLPSVSSFCVSMAFGRELRQPIEKDIPYFQDLLELDVGSCELKTYDVEANNANFVSNLHGKAQPVAHAHLAELLRRKRHGKRALLSKKKTNFVLVLDKAFRRVWWKHWWIEGEWDRLVVRAPLMIVEPCRLIVC